MPLAPLFAVHIGPGILQPGWAVGGFVLMAAAVLPALWRVGEREIPRIGVLTAAFFVASSVHVPVGAASVHLLLNGLTGVILRWRAPLAVAVGLTLQALLLSHGGLDALGVNFAVQVIPAVLAGVAFRFLFRTPVGGGSGMTLTDVCGVSLHLDLPFRRLPVFAAGTVVGGGAAAGTVLLHAVVLYFGVNVESGEARAWIAGTSLLLHLPVIAIEAVGVGFACRVLATAKPEWLGVNPPVSTGGR